MTNKKTRTSAAFTAAFFMLMLFVSMAAAQGPSPGMDISGYATINDRDVPAGSVITAQVDGFTRGSVTLSEDGVIGRPGIADKLVVVNAPTGGEIKFFVQTPQMANKLEAAETGTFSPGASLDIILTFSGVETPRSSGDSDGGSSGGGSSGGGSSGGGSSGTTPEPELISEPEAPIEGAIITFSLTGDDSRDVQLRTKDTLNLQLDGSTYPLLVKSMSDFSVLFEHAGQTFVIGEGESREVDLNGDFVTDVTISMEKIEDGAAFLTFAKLEKDPVIATGEGLTGYITANPIIPVMLFIIIAALGGVALKFRRRGSK